jgi:hypothetical protein
VSGSSTTLNAQAGTASPWTGVVLNISSTATNFQISHNGASIGNFNVKFIGS